MKRLTYHTGQTEISKEAVKNFFKASGSTPKDLIKWMKESADFHFPCDHNRRYLGKYSISTMNPYLTGFISNKTIWTGIIGLYDFWDVIRDPANIKEFKKFCAFLILAYEEEE